MYLFRQQYANPELKETLKLERAGKVTTIMPERPTLVREKIGYWHKANHIHRWFVEHVQEKRDDCHDHYVGRDQLRRLLKSVIEVLNHSKLVPGKVSAGYQILQNGERQDTWEDGLVVDNPSVAKTMLPRQRGFFFGSNDYDQTYVEDLSYTKTLLEEVLAEPADVELIYSSSW